MVVENVIFGLRFHPKKPIILCQLAVHWMSNMTFFLSFSFSVDVRPHSKISHLIWNQEPRQMAYLHPFFQISRLINMSFEVRFSSVTS